jgi:hypothetical protein
VTHQDSWLDRLREATGVRDEAAARAKAADEEWRLLISAALLQGVPAADVADSCGISRARVYQIRDGRR